jgi:hypothetical protein
MKRDTVNNEFLKLVYDFYDYIKYNSGKDNTETKEEPRGIKAFFYKLFHIKKKEEPTDSIYSRLENFSYSLRTVVPSFDRLWDFCEFIRVAEKIFFYRNSNDEVLAVETGITKNSGERRFRIVLNKDSKYYVELKFTLIKDLTSMNIIKISVVRHYGLEMTNTYTISDAEINYEDSSDLYLINELNFILMKCMYTKFNQILRYIAPLYNKDDEYDEEYFKNE